MRSEPRSPPGVRAWPAAARLALVVVCLLTLVTRLFSLDAQPIWWDEAVSIHLATSSLAEIVADRAGNLHPPLYFFFLKAWVALAGDSAFSVRYPSVWFGTLLVPALYAFARRWLDRRAGLIAAGLGALSPLYLVYAQEARVYALLPLIYLALLDLARRLRGGSRRAGWRPWLLLAGAETLALGLHYMSLFAIAYVVASLLLHLRRRAERVRLLLVQGLVALLLLPWGLCVLRSADALVTRLGVSNWRAEPVGLVHFVRLLWTFQLTGLTALIADPAAVLLTAAVALTLGGALIYLLARRNLRRATTGLLLEWLLPLASAFVVWRVRPLSHPRYVILFTPALLLLMAVVLDQLPRWSRSGRWLSVLLGIPLAATSVLGLYQYHTPRFAKDDTRGVAAAIGARSTADDLVLVPPEDWSVPYYYDGPSAVEMIGPGDDSADWERLAALTRGTDALFLVDYYRASHDPRALLPFALESAGSLEDRWGFKGLYVRVYRLDRPVAPPRLTPVDALFSPLRITGAWVEQDAPADTAVAVALRWRLEGACEAPLRIGLRLRDEEGWAWATTDDWLLDGAGLPADRWSVGQETTTYHVLPLPPGTPPLTYTPAVGVYWTEGETIRSLDLLDQAGNPRGRSFELGLTSLGPPLGLETDPYGVADRVPRWETPVEVADGLVLAGASLDRQTVAPGQVIYATLHWQAESAAEAGLDASLGLEQGETSVVTDIAPAGGRYPLQSWAAGQHVVEHRRMVVPPSAADGPATVVLRVGERRVGLGQLEIVAGQHSFDVPPMGHELGVRFGDVAELLGYDLELTEVVSGQPVPVVLYWRALEGAGSADYTVFAHLLAEDGHLVAQHDGPPAGGSQPTAGWIPGEIITDRHEMTFREAYAGAARVETGLYDAATLERVPAEGGETFALLPTAVIVLEP